MSEDDMTGMWYWFEEIEEEEEKRKPANYEREKAKMSVKDLRFIRFLCLNLRLSQWRDYITVQKNTRWLANVLKYAFERLGWEEESGSYFQEQIKILDKDIEVAERALRQIEKEYDELAKEFVPKNLRK